MGRSRTQQRRLARVDDNTDDDTLSTTSTGGSSDLGVTPDIEEEQDESTVMDSFIDALYEKRASTREAGLKGLVGAFTSNVLVEFSEEKYETLSHLFIGSVKRGGSSETILGARALGLLVLTAGAGDIAHQVLAEASPHLAKVAKLGSSPAARISALEAMAILCFVGAIDADGTETTMATLWQVFTHKGNDSSAQTLGTNSPSGAVKAAALSAWSLLLSTLHSSRIAAHHLQLSLPTLSTLLNGADLAVRTAAGEAVALLCETTKALISEDDNSESDSEAVLEDSKLAKKKVGGYAGKTLDATEAQVVEQMKALSVHAGGKGQPRKERAVERSLFRDLLATIEDGVPREVSVKLRQGDVLKVSTWSQIIQLNALRRFLAEGFQKHMQENALLHEIFDFIPRAEKRQALSTKEKRLLLSPNSVISKARTQALNRSRLKVQAGNVGHYSVMGDESD